MLTHFLILVICKPLSIGINAELSTEFSFKSAKFILRQTKVETALKIRLIFAVLTRSGR
jgi:hypothetical protein